MEVRAVKTEMDYRALLHEIETLMDANPGSAEEERLDVLTTLAQAYESKHYPVLPPDPIEAIRYEMECRGLASDDLAKVIGSRTRVLDILDRKIPLTLDMIRRIHYHMGIAAEVLIRPYPTLKPGTLEKKKAHAKTSNIA